MKFKTRFPFVFEGGSDRLEAHIFVRFESKSAVRTRRSYFALVGGVLPTVSPKHV